MRVVTLLARHGTEKYADAEHRVDEIFRTHLPRIERTVIVADTALPDDFEEHTSEQRVVLGSDNSSWEFSAWNRALHFLRNQVWDFDLVHLATSAFHTLYTDYLHRFSEPMLAVAAKRAACVGHIDCYNQPVRILSYQSQHWMRTSFLFAPPAELKMLRTLISLPGEANLFGHSPAEPWSAGGRISENYRSYVFEWLTGGDIGQGVTWHSRIAADEGSWSLFQSKARAIFNEHLLAIRLRAQGTRLIDATWLATQIGFGNSAEGIDWTRSWRHQLAERDSGRVTLS